MPMRLAIKSIEFSALRSYKQPLSYWNQRELTQTASACCRAPCGPVFTSSCPLWLLVSRVGPHAQMTARFATFGCHTPSHLRIGVITSSECRRWARTTYLSWCWLADSSTQSYTYSQPTYH